MEREGAHARRTAQENRSLASLGISPAASHPNTQVRRVGGPDAPASLTPAERLKKTDPSASLGISPAASHPNTQVRRVGDPDAPASLTPAERLNLTKLFAYFLHKKDVFLR